MNRPTSLLLLLCSSLAVGPVLAQAGATGTTGLGGLRAVDTPRLLTLDDAFQMAAERSIDLRVARARIEESDANLMRAWGSFLPHVSIGADYTYSFPEQEVLLSDPAQLEQQALLFDSIASLTEGGAAQNPDPVAQRAALEQAATLRATAKTLRTTELEPIVIQPAHAANGVVQFSMPVFNARTFPNLKNAYGATEIAKLSLLQAKSAVLWGVARSYHQLAASKQLVKTTSEQVESTKRHLTISNDRFTLGYETQLSVDRATIEMKRAEQQARQAAGGLKAAKASLAGILGLLEDFDVETPPPLAAPDQAVAFERLLEQARENRVDLRLQKEMLAISDRGRQDAWFRFLPSLQLVAQGRYTTNVGGLTTQPFTGTVGLQASLPIFDGGQTLAAIKESNAKVTQEVLRTRQLEEMIERELRGTLDDIALKRENETTAREVAELARKTAENAENLYAQGAATQLEVSDARLSAFASDVEATRARLDLETARIGLAHALGGLATFVNADAREPALLTPEEEDATRARLDKAE